MNWKKTDEILEIRSQPDLIRNVSILAHVDHGKTSISDSLISSNQIISPKLAGKLRYLDSRPDEQERCITMKSSSISLIYPTEKQNYLVNLIDSPGHVDFSSEVASALRVCDGGLLVIDVVEGVCTQTYTVLRQSWEEGVKLVLVLNKVDRLINELRMEPMDAYKYLMGIIEHANAIISGFYFETYGSDQVEDEEQSYFFIPEKGNVAFASAIDRWGFTLREFAKIYSKKMAFNPKALCSCLWGEYYYNPKAKKVVKKPFSPKAEPMFVQFILNPIWKLHNTILNSKSQEKVAKMLEQVNVSVTQRELKYLQSDPMMTLQAAMNSWLPLDKSVLAMITMFLPSPVQAQNKRTSLLAPNLFDKNPDIFGAVQHCSSEGPFSAFISKMMPIDPEVHVTRVPGDTSQHDSLIAFARVFSGTINPNSPICVVDNKGDVFECIVSHIYILMGQYLIPVEVATAGNIVGLGGLQDIVLKTATISSDPNCPSFTPISLKATPIVKVSVQPKYLHEMNNMVQGLKLLHRSDNSVEYFVQENGENILAVCGEVHLQRCIKDLEEAFAKVEVEVSEPIVSFRETVATGGKTVTDVTPNQRCSITVKAYPIPHSLIDFITKKQPIIARVYGVAVPPPSLREEFNKEFIEALQDCKPKLRKMIIEHLQAFGPKKSGCNLLVYLGAESILSKEFKEVAQDSESENESENSTSASRSAEFDLFSSMIAGFDLATNSGPLCAEPLRGVCFVIESVEFSSNEEYKDTYGPFQGQFLSTLRDACKQSVLTNSPRLVEGVYECTLQTTQDYIGKLYAVLNKRRGKVCEELLQEGTNTFVVKTTLPVAESFGFSNELRQMTSGAVMPQLAFSHWEVIQEDPFYVPKTQEELEEFGEQPQLDNLPKVYMNKVRRRKGIPTDDKLVIHAEKQRNLTKMR